MKPELAIALPTSGHYIVAVSGGVDSVALLHMLVHQPDHDLRLRVAHVNHGLRPDAASDERFVRELAAAYGLPFESIQLDLGQASEAQARERRYQYLQELLQTHRARGIITAHHGDDQLETSLFNTLRGSGRHGQAASLRRQQLLRPLLTVGKSDLYDYARSHGLAWREDATNQDTAISRNFIRHELLGERPGHNLHRQLLDRHQQLNRRLDGRLSKLYYRHRTPTGVELPRTWLGQQSWQSLAALWHYVLRQLAPDQEFSRAQIEELVRTAKTAPAGTKIGLSNRLKLLVGYDTVAVVAEAAPAPPLPRLALVPQTSLTYGPFRLSYGSHRTDRGVRLPPVRHFVRVMRPGDRMSTPAGTKKIHDIFIDNKVPRPQRQQWPLITNEQDQIVWLVNLIADPRLTQATEGFQLIAEVA